MNNMNYEFECNITTESLKEAFKDTFDEWGIAFVWLGDIGVEYNLCIDYDPEEDSYYYPSGIYKIMFNEKTGYMETDYSCYKHYEINPNNPNWEADLKEAMIEAINSFFNIK